MIAFLLWSACAPVHRYPDGTGIEGQLEREVVALQMRLRELEAQSSGRQQVEVDLALVAELKQVFGSSGLTVHDDAPCLTAPAEAVFADAYALRLRDEATMVFDLLATVMEVHPEQQLTVTGHTSDRTIPRRRGQPARDHLLLGAAQAHAFASHLARAHGVDPARVTIASRGAEAPRTSNDLPEGQADNERLELCLTPRTTDAGPPG